MGLFRQIACGSRLYKNPELASSKDVPLFPRDPRFTTTGGQAMQHFPNILAKATSAE